MQMRYFEVLRRDGPARIGRLALERLLSTPGLIDVEDYINIGSIFRFRSVEEAVATARSRSGQKKLVILPHVPSTPHMDYSLCVPSIDIDAPAGVVVHPLSDDIPKQADVYILGGAGTLENPRDLVRAVTGTRERTVPDSALYAPALAAPANLSFLVYLGIDLLDSIRMEIDGYFSRYHTMDGSRPFSDLAELPCCCEHCRALQRRDDLPEVERQRLIAAHNVLKLEEELYHTRELIRQESLREYVERQVRASPGLTAALRILDREGSYLERRTPVRRRSVLYANTAESLSRVEVTRFAGRVLERYRAPPADVLLLLPCSARKPYSRSRSHRLFFQAVGPARRFLHEVILTSPLAIVPRELEEVYPAASYDVPVTGRWDLEERAWLLSCLDRYLAANRYSTIIAHLEGELLETVVGHGIDAVFTGGGTDGGSLAKLSEAVSDACRGRRRLADPRLRRFEAHIDFGFGLGAGKALLAGGARLRGRELQDGGGRTLAIETINGSVALSIEGARLLEPRGSYIVEIGDFFPKGSILAPGVSSADEQIRPGDEVIVRGERAFGVGRAKMSGWEMAASKRGVAVEMRQIEEV